MSSTRAGGKTVVIVQPIIPDYRERFYRRLEETLQARLVVLSGDEDFAPGIRHAPSASTRIKRVKNKYILGRRFLWQSSVVASTVNADIAVLVLNPRILTTWVILAVRRARRRRTILWGHAWPRAGKGTRTDAVRHVMRRLADVLVVYTETEARELRARMPDARIIAAPNAMYSRDEMFPLATTERPTDFIYVGRHVPAKKPQLLLEAFRRALNDLPSDTRLVILGDGPMRNRLESAASPSDIAGRVVFGGHVSEVDSLRRAYAGAIASVSPGYVGLSLTQSLGFGVPMLAARDEPHAPEIEAAVEGDNLRFFESDDADSLARSLVVAASKRDEWLLRRESISEGARASYSIETMVASFISAIELASQEPQTEAIPLQGL